MEQKNMAVATLLYSCYYCSIDLTYYIVMLFSFKLRPIRN
jgi:hypothetical protein